MPLVLENVKRLLNSIRENDWYITAFSFHYNYHDYVVVFEDLRELDRGSKYFAVMLTFLDKADDKRIFETYVNSFGFNESSFESAKKFFGIRSTGNSGNPLWKLYYELNKAMPDSYHPLNKEQNDATMKIIDMRDGFEGHCCYDARRNGKDKNGTQKYRTAQNTAKTKLLRAPLFDLLGHDKKISFYYRKENELRDSEIVSNLEKRDKFNQI